MTLIRRTALTIGIALLASAAITACNDAPPAYDATAVQTSPYFAEGDRLIALNGQMIRYRESGNPQGTPVIMLHGFTDSLHTWDALAAELGPEFRVIRPDLPGHGLSGPAPEGDYSNDALVEFVASFHKQMNVDAPILIGNSLGGLAAWRYAAAEPEAVSGLILLAPGGVPYNGVGDEPAKVPAMLRYYLKSAPEAGVRAALGAMYGDPAKVTDARITEYRELMDGHGDAFVARASAFTLPDPAAEMGEISVPTLILWGENDAVLPPEQASVFIDNIPNAELTTLSGIGHLPQAEAPERVAQAVRDVAGLSSAIAPESQP